MCSGQRSRAESTALRIVRRVLVVALGGALMVLAALFILRRPGAPAPIDPPPAPLIAPPSVWPTPAALGSLPTLAPVPPASVDPIDQAEQWLFDLTNGERARHGLGLLERDLELSTAARLHSEDMLRRAFFDHVNPDRESPGDRVARTPARGTGAIGENIWMRSGSAAPELSTLIEEAIADLMASAAHRDNMLRPGFTRLGVGAAINGSDVRLTQVFME